MFYLSFFLNSGMEAVKKCVDTEVVVVVLDVSGRMQCKNLSRANQKYSLRIFSLRYETTHAQDPRYFIIRAPDAFSQAHTCNSSSLRANDNIIALYRVTSRRDLVTANALY